MRKRAVFWRAGRGVVGLIVGRKVVSQVWVGGRALEVRWVEMEVRWVEMEVARSGFMVEVSLLLLLWRTSTDFSSF